MQSHKKEVLGVRKGKGRRIRDGAKLFESHHGHVPPWLLKASTEFGTRTGGDRSPQLGEAREAPDSARQTHRQRGARPRLAATRETKQKPSLAPGVQSTPKVQLGTPLSLIPPGTEENPTTPAGSSPSSQPWGHQSSLSLPPATVTTTGPTDIDFPSEGEVEEVPQEEGFPSAHSGCPAHCRVSRILAAAAAWHRISHPDLGWRGCSNGTAQPCEHRKVTPTVNLGEHQVK